MPLIVAVRPLIVAYSVNCALENRLLLPQYGQKCMGAGLSKSIGVGVGQAIQYLVLLVDTGTLLTSIA
jgi:hypothetical protein